MMPVLIGQFLRETIWIQNFLSAGLLEEGQLQSLQKHPI